ncbi:hypothetical protein V8G54_006443 [Vigna mungo]|uniref:Uncharacterized protein n=1 Tax=Vigna mungo TaxID=3915 RepID=A0AAQ3NZ06_VIGMU
MGYVMRVRLASFFAGAATASFAGLYILHRDYKVAYQSFSHQMHVTIERLEETLAEEAMDEQERKTLKVQDSPIKALEREKRVISRRWDMPPCMTENGAGPHVRKALGARRSSVRIIIMFTYD